MSQYLAGAVGLCEVATGTGRCSSSVSSLNSFHFVVSSSLSTQPACFFGSSFPVK